MLSDKKINLKLIFLSESVVPLKLSPVVGNSVAVIEKVHSLHCSQYTYH